MLARKLRPFFMSFEDLLGSDLDSFFRFRGDDVLPLSGRFPASATERDGCFVLSVPLPGVNPANLSIEVRPESISVESKDGSDEKTKISFSVATPKTVDPDGAKAESKFGVLTVTAPLAGARGRRLEISCADPAALPDVEGNGA